METQGAISVKHGVTEAKHELRAELRARLARLDAGAIHAASLVAAARVVETEEFRRAQSVMIFLPLRNEMDTRLIALRAWQEGKSVAVPLVGKGQRHILPVTVRSLDESMETDTFGVRVPKHCELVPIEMIDFVVTPGLGFDRHGYRLGRGGGYYDRFLRHPHLNATVCGLALDEQLVERVPTEEHDAPVEMVATPSALIRCAAASITG